MSLVERAAEWPEQWLRQGRREGVAEGRREGVARERSLLRRLAALRFDDAVGGRIGALVAEVEDWDRLAAVGELIVAADSGTELVEGAAGLLRRPG